MGQERYQPQFIEETEALFGTPYFIHESGYDVIDYADDSLGLRRFVYQSGCRILAQARHEDRLAGAGEDVAAWNDSWELTVRKVAEIAFRYETAVIPLARQLALVNNASSYIEGHWEDLGKRLHADQRMYMTDVVASLQKPPRTIRAFNAEPYAVHGTTIIAPTGFGKTRLIETCAKMFEPGQPLRNCQSDRPPRILLVSPSLILLDQTAASLAEQLPDVRIGEMHGTKKEPHADIVLSTIEAFNSNFRDGKIAAHPVDVVMIDEGHHLSALQFRKTFVTQWCGISLVFTATPAYDLERDVRKIIPHVVEKTDLLKAIEKGLLNDGQILTFYIDCDAYGMLAERYQVEPVEAQEKAVIREVVDTLVLEFVTPLLEEGRRGIIFCEPGEEARWASRLAERLEAVQLSDGRTVRARAMHSYAGNQLEVMEKFRRGEYDVITTVDTGREGLDVDLDFVIVNRNITSRLRGRQIVGRGTRLSERFPTTVYGQFSYRLGDRQFERLYSIEEMFGGHTIEQRRTLLGRRTAPRPTPRQPKALDVTSFPEIIIELLDRIDRKPIGETFASINRGRRKVVEGLIPLPQILLGFQATELRAKKLLRVAGYQWYGRLEDAEGGRRLVHYYTPEARDYLHGVLPKGVHLDIHETAATLQLPVVAVRQIVNDPLNNITGRPVARDACGRPPICYNEQEREIIARLARKIPGTNKGDRRLTDVARELGVSVETAWKWAGASNKDRNPLGGIQYLTAQEIATAVAERDKIPLAAAADMTLIRIAECAGVDYQVVNRNMTPADRAAAGQRRYKDSRGYTRMAEVWPADKAAEIAQKMKRFKSRPLEAHLLPSNILRSIIRKYGMVPSHEITTLLAEGGFEVHEQIITGSRSMSRCLTWQAIQYLEGILGKTKGNKAILLDYSRLPSGPEDTDPAKIAYAQSIQALFLRPSQLKTYDSSEALE